MSIEYGESVCVEAETVGDVVAMSHSKYRVIE
jgi:hypothetical protein